MKLSVVLITYNEEANIKECLDSVAWADEIVLVDSGSADRTLELPAILRRVFLKMRLKTLRPRRISRLITPQGIGFFRLTPTSGYRKLWPVKSGS